MEAPALLAHQGGWDEILVLVAPVVLFLGIRLLERRRRAPQDGDGASTAASNPRSDEA